MITNLSEMKNLPLIGLHCHTEDSNACSLDSAEKTDAFVRGAIEKGFKAVAITNHGSMTGNEIARAAAGSDIQLIYGVEAYYQQNFTEETRPSHLILMAKNLEGLRAIYKAVTLSNYHINSHGAPVMEHKDLVECFGKGTDGFDNVIATSACVIGPLGMILLQNETIDKEVAKLEKKLLGLPSPADPKFIALCDEIANKEKLLDAMVLQYKEKQALAKKVYKSAKARATKAGDEETLKRLLEEEAESQKAADELPSLSKEKADFSKKLTKLRQERRAVESKHSRYSVVSEKIETLKRSKLSYKELYDKASQKAAELRDLFGEGNFYLELQNHGMDDEVYVYGRVASIARQLNIPVVAANDAHSLNNDEDSLRARKVIRTLRFNTPAEISPADRELYLKTPEEIGNALSEFLPEDVVLEALNNVEVIAGQCRVEFEDNPKHYPVWKCAEGKTDKQELEELARAGIEWRYKEEWTPAHEERLKYELGVIDKLGFNSYILIVQDFLNYARMLGQLKTLPEHAPTYAELKAMPKDFPTGIGVGPGRGSAVGSIVCYLTGITAIDPIKYNLLFERFLNVERVTMPDIDSDFRSDIRELVVEYCENKYGKDAVCGIMTRTTLAAKAAVRAAGRALGVERGGETTTFDAEVNNICDLITEGSIEACEELSKVTSVVGKQIIADAKLIEGVFVTVGKHAAGVCISDGDITKAAPLMYIKGKDAFCTQFDKDYVEGVGIVKMDFLGLTNLSFLDGAARNILAGTGETFNIETLPFEDAVFKKIFQKGKTNAVFQFESGGMKQMLQDFKPASFEDLILLVAAYRPGPLQYLPDIISVKSGKTVPEYILPEMEEILGATYSYPVYQEQIIQIFNKIAGFSLGEADIIRRYMSKKKTEKFAAYKDKFIDGLVAKGASVKRANEFWTQLLEFSKYAFNKSHAAAYAYVAYITAWLKCHFPKEYLCAVLNYTSTEKMLSVFGDCRERDIKVVPPHINYSVNEFSINGSGIMFGFSAIKNCGSSGEAVIKERSRGPFKSFADFLIRTKLKKNATEALIYSGAFDCFTRNRQGLAEQLDVFYEILSKIKVKEVVIENADGIKTPKQISDAVSRKQELIDELNAVRFVNSEEATAPRLNREKEYLGSFISASPLDGYKMPDELGLVPVANLEGLKKGDTVTVMGFVSDMKVKHRKSDGEELGFFKLEDQTGIVNVNCFTREFAKYKSKLAEGAVVKIRGYISVDTYNDEQFVKLVVQAAEHLAPTRKEIILRIANKTVWPDVLEKIKPFFVPNGRPLRVYDELAKKFYSTPYFVSEDIKTM